MIEPEKVSFMEKLTRWDARFNLADILRKNGIRTVAIYGGGRIGRFLAKRILQSGDIQLKCIIDRNRELQFPFDVPVVHLDDIQPSEGLDLVIMAVLARIDDESLWYAIKERVGCRVARLKEIVIDTYLYDLIIKSLDYIVGNKCTPVLVNYPPPLWRISNPSVWEKAVRLVQTWPWNTNPDAYFSTFEHLYDDLPYCSPEYIKSVFQVPPHVSRGYGNDQYQVLADTTGKYVNVVNGCRVTHCNPDVYDAKVYFFGCCVTAGFPTEDRLTIPSQVQKLLNARSPDGKAYKVENHALCRYYPKIHCQRILNTHLHPGSHVVVMTRFICGQALSDFYAHTHPLIHFYDVASVFQRPHKFEGDVIATYLHPTHRGCELVADRVYDIIAGEISGSEGVAKKEIDYSPKVSSAKAHTNAGRVAARNSHPELNEYLTMLAQYRRPGNEAVGSIVMNCNPFTNGHRYLIESASKQCDHLFVFVVQEDKSFFRFEERLEMVKRGTEDLKKVTVLPSGTFILSDETLPEYFTKEERNAITIDASKDLQTYGEVICPALGIAKRFVGEEPLCLITRQYNQAMEETLPRYGVAVQKYERMEQGGEPVSASRVRERYERSDFATIQALVPESTYQYLLERKTRE